MCDTFHLPESSRSMKHFRGCLYEKRDAIKNGKGRFLSRVYEKIRHDSF